MIEKRYDIAIIGAGLAGLTAAIEADKLGKTRIKPQLAQLRKLLGLSSQVPAVPCSVLSKQGLEELLAQIDHYLPELDSPIT